ncbi:Blue copper protein [Triticum urartu]|uniref:Blue copper protein n=1 Tax=Triticum urartu TaxID=4572 RepID=M7YKN9_TRIUA|nr:Blue copper protein [Triticum urartu]
MDDHWDFISRAWRPSLPLSSRCWSPAAPRRPRPRSEGPGGQTGLDYTTWTSDKTFAVGDTLVFNYTSKAHTVTEVNKSGYDACSGGNSLSNDDSGATTITLTTPGVHYFICDVAGHCAGGMKLAVTVTVAGGSTTGGTIPAGAAGASLVPAMSAIVVAAAAGALVPLALFC